MLRRKRIALVLLTLLPLPILVSWTRPMQVRAAGDPVIVAVGDIACGSADPTTFPCAQAATSSLAHSLNPTDVLTLGDNQYECGQIGDFQQFYNATWGTLKSITHPVPGNHEYGNCTGNGGGAGGYYSYFGPAATPQNPTCVVSCGGYYSFDIGTWHIIALNSNCSFIGGCAAGSPEETWLRNDLTSHYNACTLAYWHHPLFTSGGGAELPSTFMRPIWQDLYNAGVSLVLNGHNHTYERFAPQDPAGSLDQTHGIREIVDGTGGRNLTGYAPTFAPNSVAHDANTFGLLELTLHAGSYAWQFVPAPLPGDGTFADSGTASCVASTISLSSSSVPPGGAVKVTGVHFFSGAHVNVATSVRTSWSGSAGSQVMATASSTGSFSTSITVPANAAPGLYTVSAQGTGFNHIATAHVIVS